MLMGSLAADRVLPAVRLVVLGGEPGYSSDAHLFEQHFRSTSRLVNGLGPTESTVALQYVVPRAAALTRHALPVGYPVDGTAVRLVDDDDFDAEVYGEVVIQSPYVAVEYWRRPELTRAAFDDGATTTGRRYRTGDLGRLLPNGSLEFIGRKDRQVKLHGCRVEPGEIEAAIRQHPGVREAVVAVRGDSERTSLVAYVVPRGSDAPSSQVLRKLVASQLPDYMVPAAFIAVESLPLRANGKVDVDALPSPAVHVAPSRPAAAPRDAREERLAALWQDVLGDPRIGVEDNFFELGGDSIAAIRFATRARAAGLPVTPRLVFQHQTVAELALALAALGDAAGQESAGAAVGASRTGRVTASQLAALSSRVQFER
jgi:hypothetical protein